MSSAAMGEDIEGRIASLREATLSRAEVERVLAAFAKRNGLPAMTFDENGEVVLSFGEELAVMLAHLPQFPGVMAAAIMPPEVAGHDGQARELLTANLSDEIDGATFATLPGAGGVALCRLISMAEGDDQLFERDLLAFAELAADWIESIELAIDLGPDSVPDAEPARSRPRDPISFA